MRLLIPLAVVVLWSFLLENARGTLQRVSVEVNPSYPVRPRRSALAAESSSFCKLGISSTTNIDMNSISLPNRYYYHTYDGRTYMFSICHPLEFACKASRRYSIEQNSTTGLCERALGSTLTASSIKLVMLDNIYHGVFLDYFGGDAIAEFGGKTSYTRLRVLCDEKRLTHDEVVDSVAFFGAFEETSAVRYEFLILAAAACPVANVTSSGTGTTPSSATSDSSSGMSAGSIVGTVFGAYYGVAFILAIIAALVGIIPALYLCCVGEFECDGWFGYFGKYSLILSILFAVGLWPLVIVVLIIVGCYYCLSYLNS